MCIKTMIKNVKKSIKRMTLWDVTWLKTYVVLIGIVIGVASLLAMIGIGEGTRQRVISDMERLGGTGLIIIEVPKHRRADKKAFDDDDSYLNQNDFNALVNSSAQIEMAVPTIVMPAHLSFKEATMSVLVMGITPEYSKIRGWNIARGRFILNSDISDHRQACILGSEVKSSIFGELLSHIT